MDSPSRPERVLRAVDTAIGRPAALGIAIGLIVLWAVTGPALHFGKTWQLLINTPTMIVTYLVMFTLQNARRTGQTAMQVKLDGLLHAVGRDDRALVSIEESSLRRIERRAADAKR